MQKLMDIPRQEAFDLGILTDIRLPLFHQNETLKNIFEKTHSIATSLKLEEQLNLYVNENNSLQKLIQQMGISMVSKTIEIRKGSMLPIGKELKFDMVIEREKYSEKITIKSVASNDGDVRCLTFMMEHE